MVFADDSRRQCLDPSYAVYIQRYTNFAIVSRKLFTAVCSLFLRSRAWLGDVPTSSVPCGDGGDRREDRAMESCEACDGFDRYCELELISKTLLTKRL
jgi:hypothetical protein